MCDDRENKCYLERVEDLKFQQNFGRENEITQLRIRSKESPWYRHAYRVTNPIRIYLLEKEDDKISADTTF